MTRVLLTTLLALFLLSAAGCGSDPAPTLAGHALLPADTFRGQDRVGFHIDPETHGRQAPFTGIPVQGFSSIIKVGEGEVLALQDNGFGTLANSPDYPLLWYRLQLDFDGGTVKLMRTVPLSDPGRFLPAEPCRPESVPYLYGADLDPESFALTSDKVVYIGEEFGPWLVVCDGLGRLLRVPFDVPVPEALKPYAKGNDFYRTPDHPDVRSDGARVQANLPRSGGLEGLALLPDEQHLVVAVEKALLDDPVADRRALLEFSLADQHFTDRAWFYRMDAADLSIASLEATGPHTLLLTERDGEAGPDAVIKRIYSLDLNVTDADGFLVKTLVCDLLNLDDTAGLTRPEAGAFGLGHPFAFPFVTPEGLAVWATDTLLVANDNNYPFSDGRRAGVPDDNEFILIALPAPVGK